MADVFYLYIFLRCEAVGKELDLKLGCPHCRNEFKFTADLASLEVRVTDSPQNALLTYKFKKPFELRGKTVTEVTLGPTLWSALEQVGAKGRLDSGAAKAGIIMGSIRSFTELGAVPIAEHELAKMKKIDIEGLIKKINDEAIGPEMFIEGKCPKCSRSFQHGLEWASEDFFGTSSP
jgi:phage FluMu protein Com